MQTIAIIGLGLIGGSLGLDFSSRGYRVLGISRRSETCELALKRGAVHQADTDLSLVSSVDVVFVCTPIGSVLETIRRLRPHLSDAAVITDVASVKGDLVDAATALWPNFVGGHPMAGKAQAGIEAAEAGLFAHRPYVITPIEKTSARALGQVTSLIDQLQGRLFQCLPHEHDQAVAWISHLPVMVSSSLVQACQNEPNPAILALAKQFASSGFRDTSRVGGGDPQLGLMMSQHNRDFLLQSLAAYQNHIQQLTEYIQQEDWEGLLAALAATQNARQEFI